MSLLLRPTDFRLEPGLYQSINLNYVSNFVITRLFKVYITIRTSVNRDVIRIQLNRIPMIIFYDTFTLYLKILASFVVRVLVTRSESEFVLTTDFEVEGRSVVTTMRTSCTSDLLSTYRRFT